MEYLSTLCKNRKTEATEPYYNFSFFYDSFLLYAQKYRKTDELYETSIENSLILSYFFLVLWG